MSHRPVDKLPMGSGQKFCPRMDMFVCKEVPISDWASNRRASTIYRRATVTWLRENTSRVEVASKE